MLRWFGSPDVATLEGRGDSRGLARRLRSPDPNLRAAAAHALGRLRADEAAEPLVRLLDDEEEEVRVAASDALGQIRAAEAVHPLVRRLPAERGPVVVRMLESLRAITGREYFPTHLVELLDGLGWEPTEPDSRLRYFQLRRDWHRLSACGPPALEIARELLLGPGGYHGIEHDGALAILANMVSPDAEALLREILLEEDVPLEARRKCLEALRKRGWEPSGPGDSLACALLERDWESLAGLGPESVEALLGAVERQEEGAALALASTRDPRAAQALIDTWRTSFSAGLSEVDEALIRLGEDAVEPLLAELEQRPASKAAWLLGLIGDRRAIDPLLETFRRSQEELFLPKAFVELEVVEAIPLLVQALDDLWENDQGSETRVRMWMIMEALGALTGHEAEVCPPTEEDLRAWSGGHSN